SEPLFRKPVEAALQTGLCRMRAESLAAAFTGHRETDFGLPETKPAKTASARSSLSPETARPVLALEMPATCGLLVRDRETSVRGECVVGRGGLEPPTRPL